MSVNEVSKQRECNIVRVIVHGRAIMRTEKPHTLLSNRSQLKKRHHLEAEHG